MPIAEINDTTIYYELVGEGAPCLVLHGGLGLDHTMYRDLDALAGRLQLVYFDHRHNGRSGRPPLETVTIPQLADDAVALADHLGFDRFIVLGHSYGGFIGQELAIRHPDRVSALVLSNTAPGLLGTNEEPPLEQGPPMPPELARIFASFPTEEDELREMVEQIAPFYVHRADPALAVEHFSSVIPDADATRRGFEILATWSSIDRLGTVTCPTVVIAGRFDVVTPWPHALRITAHLTDAHAVIFEESGHIPWIDEPEMFFDTLGAWLDRFAIGRTRSAVAS